MMEVTGNIFEHIRSERTDEEFTELWRRRGSGSSASSPPGKQATGFWYDQAWSEWVLVLSGSAGLLLEDEPTPRELKRGDYLLIPAGRRHRVEWTDATEPTIWLAVHFGALSSSGAAEADNASSEPDLGSGSSPLKSED